MPADELEHCIVCDEPIPDSDVELCTGCQKPVCSICITDSTGLCENCENEEFDEIDMAEERDEDAL